MKNNCYPRSKFELFNLLRYGARLGSERSGAYLFLPDKEAQVLSLDRPLIKVIEGPIYSRVEVDLPGVVHTITLHNSQGKFNKIS